MTVAISLFTDPACPFAFSAEPARMRLRWHYGAQLEWTVRMIVLTREEGEAELLAEGARTLQRRHGMPIHPGPYERAASSEPACRAVVAAGLHAPPAQDPLLRALRVRTMAGGLLDDPDLIAAAAGDAGLDAGPLREWVDADDTGDALEADAAAARDPTPAARALDHKLGGSRDGRRYSAPSYELRANGCAVSVPGFTPVEAYEAAIASLGPQLDRRPRPDSVAELLSWAPYPLATAEVTAIMQRSEQTVRGELTRSAHPIPSGADFYWRA